MGYVQTDRELVLDFEIADFTIFNIPVPTPPPLPTPPVKITDFDSIPMEVRVEKLWKMNRKFAIKMIEIKKLLRELDCVALDRLS